MALAVTEEHADLASSVRAWAERASPPAVTRAAADGGDRGAACYRDSLRRTLAGQGLLALHVPEAEGGQGAGLTGLAIAVEELGRALVPGDYVPTMLASAVLTTAGVTGKALAALTDGSGNGAVALTADLTASAAGDGTLLISGTAPHVLGAPGADLIVLPAAEGSGTVWVAVDADSLQITAADGLDLTRAVGAVTAAR